jgi:hypothetical protein
LARAQTELQFVPANKALWSETRPARPDVLDLSRGPIRLLPGIDLVETLSEERMKGLEPSTFCMASRRSSQLSYIRASGRL